MDNKAWKKKPEGKEEEKMKLLILLSIILSLSIGCQAQSELNYRLVGGPCEGCDAVFEYGYRELMNIDTIP